MEISADNFYARLGLSPDCSQGEIKSEYRWLARKFHPDHNPDDERALKKFREITEAYEILSHPAKRTLYDQQIAQKEKQHDFSRQQPDFSKPKPDFSKPRPSSPKSSGRSPNNQEPLRNQYFGKPRFNRMAIVAFFTAGFGIGLIFGHIALSEIKKTGERGKVLAIIAVSYGWLAVALFLLGL